MSVISIVGGLPLLQGGGSAAIGGSLTPAQAALLANSSLPTPYQDVGGHWYVPPQTMQAAAYPIAPTDSYLNFSNNQWTGFVTPEDFDPNGNFITFSPLPPQYSQYFAFLLLGMFAYNMKSADGRKDNIQLMLKYLDTVKNSVSEVMKSQARANLSSHATAVTNGRVTANVLTRLGLISPRDGIQLMAYFDHVFGEILKLDYVTLATNSITTMVDAASNQESAPAGASPQSSSGLSSLANIAGGIASPHLAAVGIP